MKRRNETTSIHALLILPSFFLLLMFPLFAHAAKIKNPIGTIDPILIIRSALTFFLGLVGLIALLGIVYGGLTLIIGGMRGEQEIKRGKEILFWSIMGLLIVGLAATILTAIRGILFP